MKILFLRHKSINYWDKYEDDIELFKNFYAGKGIQMDITVKEFDESLAFFGYNNGTAQGLTMDLMTYLCNEYENPGEYQQIYICYKPNEQTGGVFTSYTYMKMNGSLVSCIPASEYDASRTDNELFRILRHESIHLDYGLLNLNANIHLVDYLDRDCQLKLEQKKALGLPYTQADATAVEDIHFAVIMNYKQFLDILSTEYTAAQKLYVLIAQLKSKLSQLQGKGTVVERLALSIAKFEGFYLAGSLAQRNNNPGNLVWSKYMDRVVDGFAHFSTVELGWKALRFQLELILNGKSAYYKPTMTIAQFIDGYASTSPIDERIAYAKSIADTFNTTVDTPLNKLV